MEDHCRLLETVRVTMHMGALYAHCRAADGRLSGVLVHYAYRRTPERARVAPS